MRENFRLRGCISLSQFTAERISEERRREEICNDYSHHNLPFRHFDDIVEFSLYVGTNRKLSDEQSMALEESLSKCMREFQHRFDAELIRLNRQKESTK